MSAATPPETVNNERLCWNVSPHFLFFSRCAARVSALAAGVNAVLMITLDNSVVVTGFPGLTWPPWERWSKRRSRKPFCSSHVILLFSARQAVGINLPWVEHVWGICVPVLGAAETNGRRSIAPKLPLHMSAAKAGVLWINHRWRLQGSSVIIH